MNTPNPSQTWNPTSARILGAIALITPIIAALLFHMENLSHIGQARFFISVRGLLIAASLASMMFMPKIFRRILDSKGIADEHELFQRARTFHASYKLLILITFMMITFAAIAANNGLTGKDMRHLLVTIGMIVLVYSMIIPFNILAWRMTPPDE